MPSIPFVKAHGLGNDYIYMDERETAVADPAAWSRQLSDRHTGIGADGLIILRRSDQYPCRMEMYNADGSRAEMCGNGIRCVALLAFSRGYASDRHFQIDTDAGPKDIQVLENDDRSALVRVAMGIPQFEEEGATLEAAGRSFVGTIVSLGNPHFVIPIEERPADYPVHEFGPPLENHARFPDRSNIEFVHVVDRGHIDFRVWERGSGETRACGTGATAAAAALHRLGQVDATSVVHLLGGDLTIEVESDGATFMTGAAVESFRGQLDASSLVSAS